MKAILGPVRRHGGAGQQLGAGRGRHGRHVVHGRLLLRSVGPGQSRHHRRRGPQVQRRRRHAASRHGAGGRPAYRADPAGEPDGRRLAPVAHQRGLAEQHQLLVGRHAIGARPQPARHPAAHRGAGRAAHAHDVVGRRGAGHHLPVPGAARRHPRGGRHGTAGDPRHGARLRRQPSSSCGCNRICARTTGFRRAKARRCNTRPCATRW